MSNNKQIENNNNLIYAKSNNRKNKLISSLNMKK